MASSSKGVGFMREIVKSAPILAAAPTSSTFVTRFFSSANYDDSFPGHRQQQNPPDPLPNRPLREERPSNPSREAARFRRQPPPSYVPFNKPTSSDRPPFESLKPSFSAVDRSKKTGDTQSDQSFLEQFKLGLGHSSKQKPQSEQKASEPLPPPEDANEIFKKMKETGLIPNAVAMLDGLCKDGLVQEAMKLFGLMREKGTIPEVVIYTAVVEGFCKAHKFEDAKRIFRKMQANGISPNAFSYTVLLQGLYKCNKLEDAVEFCVEMLEAGHSPNVATFVGLVDTLCRDKGLEEAQRVIETFRQKGFVVNDKDVKEFMDKKAPFPSLAWEAIFKKAVQKPF